MWFEAPSVSRQLFYHLRLTQIRGNVQLLLSQLEWRARQGDFFCLIHDGRKNAFFVPYSWLQARVLSRKPRIRTRPANPAQRYYTVYPVGDSTAVFSFGPDPSGKTVTVDLKRFRNTVDSEKKARAFLEATTVRSWEDREGGVVAFKKTELPERVRMSLPKAGQAHTNEGLAGPGGVVVISKQGVVFAIRKEKGANSARVVKLYEEMLSKGQVSGTLSKGVALSRPFQRALRLVALDIYRGRCAMCDVDVPSQLVTSHIVPVGRAAVAARPLPSNVILLCRLHDGLFDKHLLTVRLTYRITCSPKLQTKSRLLKQWALRLDGRKLSLPSRHPPDRVFLEEHLRESGVV